MKWIDNMVDIMVNVGEIVIILVLIGLIELVGFILQITNNLIVKPIERFFEELGL